MIEQKCQDRLEMYRSGKRSPAHAYAEFDDSKESWFVAGWNSKRNSLIYLRTCLLNAFNKLPKDGSIPFEVFSEISTSMVALGGEPLDLLELSQVYIERFKPLRIVMREGEQGLRGLVEHSFAMDFDEKRACVFWSGKAYSILGEHMLDGQEWAKSNAKEGDYIFDPLDPMCPVQVDWPAWLIAKDKFGKRNPPFVRKTFEVDEEDGCLA